jgi:uncharacterized protein YqgC (DUF456 family)
MEVLAWLCAMGGLLLGGVSAFIPGFPGSAVALLGLVAFAGLTDFTVVTSEALVLATVIALGGALGQIVAPVVSSRAAGGTAGVATGAALGAALGALIPLPGASWGVAIVGATLLGIVGSREGFLKTIRGIVGTAGGGCAVAVLADLVSVLGIAAVLAVADFLALVS